LNLHCGVCTLFRILPPPVRHHHKLRLFMWCGLN
jgi:hypothetical protein